MRFLFTINESYVDPIKPLLYSIYDNIGRENEYYFLYSNLSEKSIIDLTTYILKKCKGTVRFVFFPYLNIVRKLPLSGNWTNEIYYRLFAPYIFKDVDQIIYLDGDTLITGNLSEIVKFKDDDSFVIAGVKDVVQEINIKRLNISESDAVYINSGVLVINLNRWRELLPIEDLLSKLQEYKNLLTFPDQDFINLVWQSNIRLLPRSYNYMINLTERNKYYITIKKPEIIHYVFTKPWLDYYEYHSDGPYLTYLRKSGNLELAISLWKKHSILRLKMKIKNLLSRRSQ